MESNETNSCNMFVEPIMAKKKKHDFRAWCKLRKLIKYVNRLSPSFDIMLTIYDFLLLIRNMYMHDNNERFHLFLGSIDKGYDPNKTFAMVYKENGFSIKYVLVVGPRKNQINIEIIRNAQNRKDAEKIRFYDGEYQFKDEYDQEKMLFITACLMNGLVELIEYYYKNKKL